MLMGGGSTHAWVEFYLPGAGWMEFDPTNGLVGGVNLIRVAVARDAHQAIPLTGSFYGFPEDFIDMKVSVNVSSQPLIAARVPGPSASRTVSTAP
jgi:transglutaminase-like putative cysteine protease